MLGGRGDEVVALAAVHRGHALEGEVVALGGAAGEDDLAALAPISPATCSRAGSTASSASRPKAWCRLAALP